MKKRFLILMLASMAVFCSCDKENPEREVFRFLEEMIDSSQKNKYDEKMMCQEWCLTKVTNETYFDGALVGTEDITGLWDKMRFEFRPDHTMTYCGTDGRWQYLFNHLFYVTSDGGNNVWEVLTATPEILLLKSEELPLGPARPPYFQDPSGTHNFNVFEYRIKQ